MHAHLSAWGWPGLWGPRYGMSNMLSGCWLDQHTLVCCFQLCLLELWLTLCTPVCLLCITRWATSGSPTAWPSSPCTAVHSTLTCAWWRTAQTPAQCTTQGVIWRGVTVRACATQARDAACAWYMPLAQAGRACMSAQHIPACIRGCKLKGGVHFESTRPPLKLSMVSP
jgi:hypothetical protein